MLLIGHLISCILRKGNKLYTNSQQSNLHMNLQLTVVLYNHSLYDMGTYFDLYSALYNILVFPLLSVILMFGMVVVYSE